MGIDECVNLPKDYQGQADLTGQCVLITGASGGVGTHVSQTLARCGAKVILLGRNVPALERCYDDITSNCGDNAAIYPLDLEGATPKDYASLANAVQSEYGGLNALVHCANQAPKLRPFGQMPTLEWYRQFQVAVHGPMMLTQALWPLLQEARPASVVFSVDDLEETSGAYWLSYGASQWTLRGMLRMLAAEGQNSAIRVLGLNPGPRRTALRGELFAGEAPGDAADPAAAAVGYLYLLDRAGNLASGAILRLVPV